MRRVRRFFWHQAQFGRTIGARIPAEERRVQLVRQYEVEMTTRRLHHRARAGPDQPNADKGRAGTCPAQRRNRSALVRRRGIAIEKLDKPRAKSGNIALQRRHGIGAPPQNSPRRIDHIDAIVILVRLGERAIACIEPFLVRICHINARDSIVPDRVDFDKAGHMLRGERKRALNGLL